VLSDRTFDNAILSINPFALILGAFIAALLSTVFAVGERLQRETEGLV
jgi:tetrahydromethanopterin S-methyltransferase subunit E